MCFVKSLPCAEGLQHRKHHENSTSILKKQPTDIGNTGPCANSLRRSEQDHFSSIDTCMHS